MPIFWVKERTNFVAIKFSKAEEAKVAETFATPASTDNVDTELLSYLKEMKVGDAIEINLKESGLKSERSLKVRVNKHAKLAKREMDWRKVDGGNFMLRVDAIIEDSTPSTNSSNGAAETTTEGATDETTARTRGR